MFSEYPYRIMVVDFKNKGRKMFCRIHSVLTSIPNVFLFWPSFIWTLLFKTCEEIDRHNLLMSSPWVGPSKKSKGAFGSYLVLPSYDGFYHFKFAQSIIKSGRRSIGWSISRSQWIKSRLIWCIASYITILADIG